MPLHIDYKNQLTFKNKEEQYNYFNSLPFLEMDDCTYLRKNSTIAWNGNFDDIIEYNYVMYQNENYSDKWFYAFITDLIYENDYLTYIKIETDVFQTWQFDINIKQSFVERQHINVADDIPRI